MGNKKCLGELVGCVRGRIYTLSRLNDDIRGPFNSLSLVVITWYYRYLKDVTGSDINGQRRDTCSQRPPLLFLSAVKDRLAHGKARAQTLSFAFRAHFQLLFTALVYLPRLYFNISSDGKEFIRS
eukprot:1125010-Amorphochlora_amoeboformis.AAC.1